MMPLRGDKRYTVTNGWIVDIKTKKLVKPSPRSLRDLASKTRESILRQPLNDWQAFFENASKSVIVPTTDEELFRKLSSALYVFCEMRDGSVHLMMPRIEQRYRRQIKCTFSARCHKVNLGGRKTKYLRLVPSQNDEPEHKAIEIQVSQRSESKRTYISIQELQNPTIGEQEEKHLEH